MEKLFRNETFYRNHYLYKNLFSIEECELIIKCFKSQSYNQATVLDMTKSKGNQIHSMIENSVRKGHLVFFHRSNSELSFVFDKLDFFAAASNFGWNLNPLDFIQITEYDSHTDGGFYKRHRDIIVEQTPQRIVSSVTQLSPKENYTGCDLVFDDGKMLPQLGSYSDQGDTIFFLSDEPHEVTPILSGTRYSIAAWFVGQPYWTKENLLEYF